MVAGKIGALTTKKTQIMGGDNVDTVTFHLTSIPPLFNAFCQEN